MPATRLKPYQNALRETDAYKTTTAKYGTGSDLQRGIRAATAALQGLAGSDLTAALAGASAPELAYRIGHDMGIDNNTAAKTIAHAIWAVRLRRCRKQCRSGCGRSGDR